MIIIINAGGSGSRLWPLSTPDYPKHLLRFNGGNQSLLQSTYERVKDAGDDVFIITEKSHAHHVVEQLPDIPEENIIIEPARMSTGPCLLLAMRHVAKKHGEDMPVAMLWADHVVRDVEGFRDSIKHAAHMSRKHSKVVILGIEPTYANPNLGYIEKGKRLSEDNEKEVYELKRFKEKPSRDIAEEFVRSGDFLWNCGYAFAPVKVFVDTMQRYAPDFYADYQKLNEASDADLDDVYKTLTSIAIDYAFSEKVQDALTVPAAFDWLDVGNFGDLHTVSHHDDDGNAVKGDSVQIEEVSNSYIRNDTEHKVAVIGLDNVAVVMTEHGLVVANRNHAHRVGDVSKRFKK